MTKLKLCFDSLNKILLTILFTAASFKAGKVNVTASNPGLFACKKVSFPEPFHGGKEIKVFASLGHSARNPTRGNGAAIWVESENIREFRTCISEYGDASNSSAEANWVAVQSVPSGAQIGSTSLDPWTTGTECKRIDFPQVSFLLACLLFTWNSRSGRNLKKAAKEYNAK